jgi:CelD/BcsL family acetyltransferase involved in cellulose biosynthesis
MDPVGDDESVMDDTRLIESTEGLHDLASAWEEVAAPGGSPMQRYAWVGAFADAYGDQYDLKVLAAESGGEVEAIAPLVTRRDGITRLELAGVDALGEPADFVYRDQGALERLAAGVADTSLPMLLGRIVADSPTVEALRAAYRRRTIFYSREAAPFPVIPLDDGWREPESKFKSDRRSDLRRARRRAEEAGELTTEVLLPAPGELAPLLEELFRVEAAGWKGREGTALATDDRRRRFFTSFAHRAAEAGFLRLAFLRIGGRAAAVQLAAECGGRFWLLKVGFDEEFKRSSPGTLLMLETIRFAAERGATTYEFLGTVEKWTQFWTEQERDCVALRAYPARPGGLAAAALDARRFARRGTDA